MKVGARIYYLKNTDEIIITVKDKMGFVKDTSISEDYENYIKLSEYKIDAIDRIELKYGELDELLFNNKANSYYIEKGELKFKYIDKSTGEEVAPPTDEFVKQFNVEEEIEKINHRCDIISDGTYSVIDMVTEMSLI